MESLTYQTYHEGVKGMAQNIIEECITYGSELSDMVHEQVDGDSWMIYTFYHDQIIEYTKNQDAYLDVYSSEDLGELIKSKGLEGVIQARAFFAMDADLRQAIYDLKDELEERFEKLENDIQKIENDIQKIENDMEEMSEEMPHLCRHHHPIMELRIKEKEADLKDLNEELEGLEKLLGDI